MNNYEINTNTYILLPIGLKTRVIEQNKTFIVNKSTYDIMCDSCLYFGSSLEGRKKGTENMIGIRYKTPIIIEESNNIIFFPTESYKSQNCIWISLNNINRYYNLKNQSVIEFKNNKKIYLNLSYGIIENQILRSTRLDAVLRGRK